MEDSLDELLGLVIALIVYTVIRWAQRRFPDPPPRPPRPEPEDGE